MSAWEYWKIDLNELPRGRDEIDLLCAAGDEAHAFDCSMSEPLKNP